ncbi:hypothetical protein ElyMa_004097300 [Elysia marginata]|uniref:Uncharacterized protein n=1 Tax=Elysia marginata TaxID=1093978 RepID=A0AAV4G9E8_9GAST|nr:hypothetical protein ElyMa_004097300 [Elysia marginata]
MAVIYGGDFPSRYSPNYSTCRVPRLPSKIVLLFLPVDVPIVWQCARGLRDETTVVATPIRGANDWYLHDWLCSAPRPGDVVSSRMSQIDVIHV